MEAEKKYFGGWFVWILVLLVMATVVFTALGGVGLITKTVLHREVLVRSHQYKEARSTEIATFEATLAEIDRQLMNSDLSEKERADLEGQAASTRIMLRTARSK